MSIWASDIILRTQLSADEGVVLKPYKDTVGKLTIGIGRNLTDRGISLDEAAYLLGNDIDLIVAQLDKGMSWWRTMNLPQQRVLINLAYNMGYAALETFHQFLDFMQRGDWKGAADDLQNTAWYTQVGQRGPRTVARLLAGVSDDA